MLALVVRYRFLIWLRSLRSRRGRWRLGPGVTAALYLLVALFIGVNTAAFVSVAHHDNPGSELGLLFLPIVGVVFIALLSGIGVALNELFVESDVELLLTTPLSDVYLFLLKLYDCSLPAWPTAGWGLASLAGYGIALGLGGGYFLTALLTMLLLGIDVVALDVALVLVLARLVPPRRLRGGVLLVSAVAGVAVWIAWTAGTTRGAIGSTLPGRLTTLDSWLRWTPLGWAHAALAHAQQGEPGLTLAGLALLALFAAAVVLCGFALFARVYLASWSASREAPATRRRRARVAVAGSAGAPSPALSIAIKDWRTLRRDVPYLSTLLPSLIYALAYPFLLLRIPTGHSIDGRWAGLAGLPLVPLLAASTLAVTAIGREGKSFEVLRASPVAPADVLAGKVIAVAVPMALLTAAAGIGLAAYHHAPAPACVVAALGGIWLGAGCSAIGVAAGALRPDFEAKPSRRGQNVSNPGCLLYLALAVLFGAGSALVVAVGVARALHHGGAIAGLATAVIAFLVLFVALSATAVLMLVGLARLTRLLGPEE